MPDRPQKPDNNPSGSRGQDGQATAREARLATALRANLRRRKAAGRQAGADDSPGNTAAAETPASPQEGGSDDS